MILFNVTIKETVTVQEVFALLNTFRLHQNFLPVVQQRTFRLQSLVEPGDRKSVFVNKGQLSLYMCAVLLASLLTIAIYVLHSSPMLILLTCSILEWKTMDLRFQNKTKLCSGPASPVHIFNVLTIIMQSLNIKE